MCNSAMQFHIIRIGVVRGWYGGRASAGTLQERGLSRRGRGWTQRGQGQNAFPCKSLIDMSTNCLKIIMKVGSYAYYAQVYKFP